MNQDSIDSHALPVELQRHFQSRQAAPHSQQRGSWLIFTDSHGLGQELAYHLEARGENCILVSPGHCYQFLKGEQWYWLTPTDLQDFQRFFRDVQENGCPPCRGVLYLWGLDGSLSPAEITAGEVELPQPATLTLLIQALARASWREAPRLWMIVRGIEAVEPTSAGIAIAQSLLWEMTQKLAHQEELKLWSGIIDLDPTVPADEAALLFAEIWHPRGEAYVAFRHGQRFAAQAGVHNSL